MSFQITEQILPTEQIPQMASAGWSRGGWSSGAWSTPLGISITAPPALFLETSGVPSNYVQAPDISALVGFVDFRIDTDINLDVSLAGALNLEVGDVTPRSDSIIHIVDDPPGVFGLQSGVGTAEAREVINVFVSGLDLNLIQGENTGPQAWSPIIPARHRN